jgi:flagellar hook assembly protein FlgD
VRVWDVSNNSAEDQTHFIVAENASLALENVLNYPNPFTTHTQFFLNHNRPGEDMDVLIQIFSVSGRLVKTLQSSIATTGNIINHIEWDGLDDFGDRIGRGAYVYKVTLRIPRTGERVTEFQKLVVLR